jgi:alanine racemase
VGYNRAWVAQRDTTVATLPIGYADGFKRLLSNGVGTVSIRGERFYVIGNICMDLTMIDVTGSNVKEGDEVEIFGDTISLAEFADKCNTIQYEVMTSVSGRVSRIYLWE